MPKPPPESTKISLRQRLTQHAQARWPALTTVGVRYRGVFAYIDGYLSDGTILPLCRLRYNGSASIWSFAIYLASRDGYEESILPSGLPAGSPEEALDCACGLYLDDPAGWLIPPTNQRRGPLRLPIALSQGTGRVTSSSGWRGPRSARRSSERPSSRCCCTCPGWTAGVSNRGSRTVRRWSVAALKPSATDQRNDHRSA